MLAVGPVQEKVSSMSWSDQRNKLTQQDVGALRNALVAECLADALNEGGVERGGDASGAGKAAGGGSCEEELSTDTVGT